VKHGVPAERARNYVLTVRLSAPPPAGPHRWAPAAAATGEALNYALPQQARRPPAPPAVAARVPPASPAGPVPARTQ
jgi:hypothetical protein